MKKYIAPDAAITPLCSESNIMLIGSLNTEQVGGGNAMSNGREHSSSSDWDED